MSTLPLARLAQGVRSAQTVRTVAVVLAVLAVVEGAIAVISRAVFVLGLGAGNPTMGMFRLGWGPQGMMSYLDAMTLVAALGGPVGLLSLAALGRKQATPPRVPACSPVCGCRPGGWSWDTSSTCGVGVERWLG